MENCKNCRFFDSAKYDFYTCKEYGENLGKCNNSKFVYIEQEKVPDGGLGYGDSECYSAFFYVHENFGCVNFQGKKQN